MRSTSGGAPSPARWLLPAGNGEPGAGAGKKPGPCWGLDGAGRPSGPPGRAQLSRRIGGGAFAVLWFTSKGPACISAGRGGRSRGQQFVSAFRCRFKRRSPREREVRAERKYPARRSRVLSLGFTARPRPRLAGVWGPSRQPRPGRCARHWPGTPPAAAARRRSLPEPEDGHWGLLSGKERQLQPGGARRDRGVR